MTYRNNYKLFPSKGDAQKLLLWGYEQNPGPWADHCRVVARVAETIARKCGLHTEKAYVLGLLHDIGYYGYRNGKGRTCHIYAGYELMMNKGYDEVARICLSHSFPYQDLGAYGGSDMNCSEKELNILSGFLSNTTYNEYDKLIQLSDCLGTAQGVCLMEQRMLNVTMRHGFGEFTISRWQSFLSLKDSFDKMCGMNIYNLFYDEVKTSIFGHQ